MHPGEGGMDILRYHESIRDEKGGKKVTANREFGKLAEQRDVGI